MSDFFCDPLEDKIVYSFRVEGLFVLRPVANLDFVLVFDLWAQQKKTHFKIWLDCHKFKKFPCLIMPMSTKCQKNENKMTINVIQHDDRL
jgi:hypothetical protein